MKHLIRSFLINLGALWVASNIFTGLEISGGLKGLAIGALAFMAVNILLVPLIKVLLLPLNLLTLGIFAWLSNVLALYVLVTIIPYMKLAPYYFPGAAIDGFIIPPITLTTFYAAIVVSFLIGSIIHFTNWIIK